MIKIAIISDIHANLPALKAVIQSARQLGAMMIWNLGDNCGYGPYPNEIIKLISTECEYNLIGNYDKKVLKYAGLKKNIPNHTSNDKKTSFIWTWNELTPENKQILADFPFSIYTFLSSYRVTLVHGTPESDSEGIDDNTPIEKLKELFKTSKSNIILSGHTHKQLYKQIGKHIILNPGSVGRPDDNDPRAAYAIITINDDENIDVEMHRIKYDVEQVIQGINTKNLPISFTSIFSQGLPYHLINPNVVIIPPFQLKELIAKYILTTTIDINHSLQVADYSMLLFNILKPLHNLDDNLQNILNYAAMLHDIGWSISTTKHHKFSAELIRTSDLPFTASDRELTALIARYHRKTPPSENHSAFAALPYEDKLIVRTLSAILRIADGLDSCHQQHIIDIKCRITKTNIYFTLISKTDPVQVINSMIKKSDFMVELFKRKITFKWKIENK